jgi:hypothetical protein
LAPRPDAPGHLHAAFDLLGRHAQPRPQFVGQHGHELDLVGRVGDLAEYPIHQAPIGAFLSLQSLGQLHPKLVAHLIRGQRPHLVVGSVNLVGQLAKSLACCGMAKFVTGEATLTTASAKHGGPLFDPVQPVDQFRTVNNPPSRQRYAGGTC